MLILIILILCAQLNANATMLCGDIFLRSQSEENIMSELARLQIQIQYSKLSDRSNLVERFNAIMSVYGGKYSKDEFNKIYIPILKAEMISRDRKYSEVVRKASPIAKVNSEELVTTYCLLSSESKRYDFFNMQNVNPLGYMRVFDNYILAYGESSAHELVVRLYSFGDLTHPVYETIIENLLEVRNYRYLHDISTSIIVTQDGALAIRFDGVDREYFALDLRSIVQNFEQSGLSLASQVKPKHFRARVSLLEKFLSNSNFKLLNEIGRDYYAKKTLDQSIVLDSKRIVTIQTDFKIDRGGKYIRVMYVYEMPKNTDDPTPVIKKLNKIEFPADLGAINEILVSEKDKNLLLAITSTNLVRVDLQSGKIDKDYYTFVNPQFYRDTVNNLLVVGSDSADIQLISLESFQLLGSIPDSRSVRYFNLSYDNRFISYYHNKEIHVFDILDRKFLVKTKTPFSENFGNNHYNVSLDYNVNENLLIMTYSSPPTNPGINLVATIDTYGRVLDVNKMKRRIYSVRFVQGTEKIAVIDSAGVEILNMNPKESQILQ